MIGIEEIGQKIANSVIQFFADDKNVWLINRLKASGVNTVSGQQVLDDRYLVLKGKKFLITGSFENYTRDEIVKMMEKHGGMLISSVSKNLDYLVVGENAGSKLSKAQQIESINIIGLNELFEMFD